MEVSSFSYHKFVSLALEVAQRRTELIPLPLQEQYKCIKAADGKTLLRALSFRAPKVRLQRSLTIDGGQAMQVLDFAAFPEPEFNLPIFCANFFTASGMNIVVLDLNPLHDVISKRDYKDKYYKNLLPLGQKYAELLPWGDKITSESLRFFSPIVIWSKFTSTQVKHEILYEAFMDYFEAWLDLMDEAHAEKDESQIIRNCEAQHRYLTWRAEKDPGHQLLKKLVGGTLAKDIVRNFLFNGVDTIGTKTFLDYFPEYQCADGTINKKRSIIGKSFGTRPWDAHGEFIGTNVR
ncbi:phytochromobilin:ferredoxin oxidoreductase, chloroplastic [Aristolochia californica]|uniref:phytochromobilin:ferredoxin oxidoreductase, chloroplastic n=1 Tax=Aristolochia californica TaxID=171875 RepID=UPI0035D71E36